MKKQVLKIMNQNFYWRTKNGKVSSMPEVFH